MKISVSLPDELVKAIDAERRDVSRSRFIRRALEAVAPREKTPSSQSERSPTSTAEMTAETDAADDAAYAVHVAGNGPLTRGSLDTKPVRRSLAKPPLQRPIIQKRGK